QRDAVGVRHPDVEQHHRGPALIAIGAGLPRVLRALDRIALVLEDFREKLPDADLVIHHQDFVLRRHVFRSTQAAAAIGGSAMLTCAPLGAEFSMRTLPPCSSMLFLTIASPKPVPLGFVVT